jgi:4-amino-4-deoxy-L-arabinose transferase-like glycosyltransferase
VLDRWSPAAWAAIAACIAVVVRLPFLGTPLTADEGGYGEVARLWSRGASLYGQAWVDRPQGLLLVFRGMLHIDGGSATALRVAAALASALLVVLTMVIALRLAGRIPAILAGLLLATAGASPYIEAFTLSGELLAAVPAAASMICFIAYLRRGHWGWLVACGLLTGCAVMTKQSGFDAGMAAVLFLLVTRRRGGVLPAAVIVATAAVPVAAGALLAPNFGDWWYAMVTYRRAGDSLFSGPPQHRLYLFVHSLPGVALAIPLMIALAVYGWRRSPLLAKLWLLTASLGVVGGGNFHHHYYLQLCPPLAVLGGIGAARLREQPRRLVAIACAGLAAGTLIAGVPLWFRSADAQATAVFHDKHLPHDGPVADWLREHSSPRDKLFVMWAAADLYYLTDRDPAVRYMWYRPLQSIPGALDEVHAALASPDRPRYVVGVHKPGMLDKSGATGKLLKQHYRQVAVVDGVPIYEAR